MAYVPGIIHVFANRSLLLLYVYNKLVFKRLIHLFQNKEENKLDCIICIICKKNHDKIVLMLSPSR